MGLIKSGEVTCWKNDYLACSGKAEVCLLDTTPLWHLAGTQLVGFDHPIQTSGRRAGCCLGSGSLK